MNYRCRVRVDPQACLNGSGEEVLEAVFALHQTSLSQLSHPHANFYPKEVIEEIVQSGVLNHAMEAVRYYLRYAGHHPEADSAYSRYTRDYLEQIVQVVPYSV